MVTLDEKKEFVDELRKEWKAMWQERIDDKVRAEGVSDKDYSLLFIERGTVIMATRKFRSPDFYEILQKHLDVQTLSHVVPPNSAVGGWGKFMRGVLNKKQPQRRREHRVVSECVKKAHQQFKKGGRGWLHLGR